MWFRHTAYWFKEVFLEDVQRCALGNRSLHNHNSYWPDLLCTGEY